MNETAPVQKQDIDRLRQDIIYSLRPEIKRTNELLEVIIEILHNMKEVR